MPEYFPKTYQKPSCWKAFCLLTAEKHSITVSLFDQGWNVEVCDASEA
jgi:hypothetical protein